MRKYINIIAALGILVILSAVGYGKVKSGPNPSKVLSKYFDASIHGRYEEAYQYLSTSDKAVKSLQEYLSEQSEEESPFMEALVSKISYNIKDVEISGDHAKADVVVTEPDLGSIFVDVMGVALASAFGDKKDTDEMEKKLAEKYKGKDIPMTTVTQPFNLVKEEGGWKIFFDWETKKKVNEALSQAKKLEEDGKLYAARDKYEEALKLNNNIVEASAKVDELNKKIRLFEEKQAYINKVKILDLKVAKGYPKYLEGLEEYLDSSDYYWGVFGKIKNTGNKTLKEVELTIYFLDKNGQRIYEDKYYPVLTSSLNFTGDGDKPLKPNYIVDFGYKTDDVPSEWAKKIEAKITNIEFED